MADDDTLQEQTSNGIIVRGPGGRFAPGTKPANVITRENAPELARLRREKARARLRARIREETAAVSRLPVNSSADAVAEAGAMLWSEVVLNSDAYPRDRLEAFLKIGSLLGILPDGSGSEHGSGSGSDTAALAALSREQILAYVQERQRERRAAAAEAASE